MAGGSEVGAHFITLLLSSGGPFSHLSPLRSHPIILIRAVRADGWTQRRRKSREQKHRSGEWNVRCWASVKVVIWTSFKTLFSVC